MHVMDQINHLATVEEKRDMKNKAFRFCRERERHE